MLNWPLRFHSYRCSISHSSPFHHKTAILKILFRYLPCLPYLPLLFPHLDETFRYSQGSLAMKLDLLFYESLLLWALTHPHINQSILLHNFTIFIIIFFFQYCLALTMFLWQQWYVGTFILVLKWQLIINKILLCPQEGVVSMLVQVKLIYFVQSWMPYLIL